MPARALAEESVVRATTLDVRASTPNQEKVPNQALRNPNITNNHLMKKAVQDRIIRDT